jgi:hypothetical protein
MDDATSRPLAPRLLAAGTAVPFALAIFAHIAGSSATPVALPPVRGALVFDQYLVDLGHVPATQDVIAYFDFTNRSSRPVEIQSLEPSCGCLRPRLEKFERRIDRPAADAVEGTSPNNSRPRVEKKVYEPGEGGFFSVRVQTANQSPGQKEYTVKVKYRDPEPREAVVIFRVVLPDEQVLVRPIALMFYQLGDGNSESEPQKFEVLDRRGQHLNIAKVECSHPDIKIEETTSEVDEAGVWHGRFEVKVPNQLPPGQTETIVRIHTDDPADQYHVLRIPLYLVGPSPRRKFDGQIQQTGGTLRMKHSTGSKTKMRLPH